MKTLCVLIVTMFMPALAEALTLDGHIRDARTHMVLSDVKVELLYLGVRVGLEYSNSQGEFFFRNVEPLSYTISATLSGYDAVAIPVDASRQSQLFLDLTPIAERPKYVPPTVSLREFMIPETARKEFSRAQKEIERKDCVKAIAHLENGLRLYDQNAVALNDLGNCRRKLGDLQSAQAAFKRAMALSDAPYIAMNLAEAYTAEQRFAEADAVLMEAIRKAPNDGDVYYSLAVSYFKQARFEDAEAAALQADSRNHRIPDLHLLLAKIYFKLNPDKVVPQLELYLKEAPNGTESKRVREALKAAGQPQP